MRLRVVLLSICLLSCCVLTTMYSQSAYMSFPSSGSNTVALSDSIRISVVGAIDTANARLWSHSLMAGDSTRYVQKPNVYIVADFEWKAIPDSLEHLKFVWGEEATFTIEGDSVILVHPNVMVAAVKIFVIIDSLPVLYGGVLHYVSEIDSFTTVLPSPKVDYCYLGTRYEPLHCSDSATVKLDLPISSTLLNSDSLLSLYKISSHSTIDSVRMLPNATLVPYETDMMSDSMTCHLWASNGFSHDTLYFVRIRGSLLSADTTDDHFKQLFIGAEGQVEFSYLEMDTISAVTLGITPTPTVRSFRLGESMTFTAPKSINCYTFDSWYAPGLASLDGKTNPDTSVVMPLCMGSGVLPVEARYSLDPGTLYTLSDSTGGALRVEWQHDSIGAAGTYYTCNDVRYSLSAVASPGNRFIKWTSNVAAINNAVSKVIHIGYTGGYPTGWIRPDFDPIPYPLVCTPPYQACLGTIDRTTYHEDEIPGDNALHAPDMVDYTFDGIAAACSAPLMTPGTTTFSVSLKTAYQGCFYIQKVSIENDPVFTQTSGVATTVTHTIALPGNPVCNPKVYVYLVRKDVLVDIEAKDNENAMLVHDLHWRLTPLPLQNGYNTEAEYGWPLFDYIFKMTPAVAPYNQNRIFHRVKYRCGTNLEVKFNPTTAFDEWNCGTGYYCPPSPTVNPLHVVVNQDYTTSASKVIGAKFDREFKVEAVMVNPNAIDRSITSAWYKGGVAQGVVARFNVKDLASGDLNVWMKFSRPIKTSSIYSGNIYFYDDFANSGQPPIRYDACGTDLSSLQYVADDDLANVSWSESNTVLRFKVKAEVGGTIYKALKGTRLKLVVTAGVESAEGGLFVTPFKTHIHVENPEVQIEFPKFGTYAYDTNINYDDVVHFIVFERKVSNRSNTALAVTRLFKVFGRDLTAAAKTGLGGILDGEGQYTVDENSTTTHTPAGIIYTTLEVPDNERWTLSYASMDLNQGRNDEYNLVQTTFDDMVEAEPNVATFWNLQRAVLYLNKNIWSGWWILTDLYSEDALLTRSDIGAYLNDYDWAKDTHNWGANDCFTTPTSYSRQYVNLFFRSALK